MNSDFQAGSRIGQYVLASFIGGGGYGSVWLAHTADGSRRVAVKLLTGTMTEGENAALRADIEVLAATAAARSPHVVKVLGGGVEPVPYIVMEYIEGNDLASLLQTQGRLDSKTTILVGMAISDALRALSEAGIIHRDIKPANVMIDSDGVVKLADFGIAKIVGFQTLTVAGQTAMTMAYAAPEVWDDSGRFGMPGTKLDLYALGVVLFQCLTGVPPFSGNFGALYRQHTETPPDLNTLPKDVPPSLRLLIGLCLEKRQQDRPRDAGECLAILQRAEAELEQSSATREPGRLGPWVKEGPHEHQVWAWHAHHESRGDRATVEVHFSDEIEYGATLRRAVIASRALSPLGTERLLETNRLMLHPEEAWYQPPPGRFQFWIAREDKAVTAATFLSGPMLESMVRALDLIILTAQREGVQLDFGHGNLTLLADGGVYLRRPGLSKPDADASATLMAQLKAVSAFPAAQALLQGAVNFPALTDRVKRAADADGDATLEKDPDATVMGTSSGPAPTVLTTDPNATVAGRNPDATVIGRGDADSTRIAPQRPPADSTVVLPRTGDRGTTTPPPATPPAQTPPQRSATPPPASGQPQARPPQATPPAPQPRQPQQPVVARRISSQQSPAAATPANTSPVPSYQTAVPRQTQPPRQPPPAPPAATKSGGGRPWWLVLGTSGIVAGAIAAAAFFLVFDKKADAPTDGEATPPASTTPLAVAPTTAPALIDGLVFSSDRAGHEEVYVMKLDGTGVTRLTNTPKVNRQPNASPDGGTIVFVSARDADGSELYSMKSDGTAQVRLAVPEGTKLEPNISPDGKKIVFEILTGDNYEIYVCDIDGRNVVNLTKSPFADIDPVWSPDGRRIVFGSNREGNMDIYTMNADGSGARRLTNSPGFNGEPGWSPDGRKIVFESDRRGNMDIYVMNDDGTGVTRLGDDPLNEFDPAWSPDGRFIAYTAQRGNTNEVFVMNADGTNARNVTNTPAANDGKPAWTKLKP